MRKIEWIIAAALGFALAVVFWAFGVIFLSIGGY